MRFFWVIIVSALAGCVTTEPVTSGTAATDEAAAVTEPDSTPAVPIIERPADRLSAQDLPAGACGLFVWEAGPQKRFILFSRADEKATQAVWFNGSAEETLTVTDTFGERTQAQYPSQDFLTEAERSLSLRLRQTHPVENGTAYQKGTLKMMTEDEFERVMPVVGLSACQPPS